jgi:nicotinamidase-related amidase
VRLRAVDTFRYWPAFEISFGAGFRCPFAAIGVLELMPPLAALCPPAAVIDKTRYSGFAEPKLLAHLREREADALIISGSETDVCVLATVLSAVDLGYRVIVVRDAVCSSSDEGHDMLLRLYHTRFSEQIETADAETILSRWQ